MFALKEFSATIVDFNPRRELHGEEPMPAADLKLSIKVGNDVLEHFHPKLRKSLYHYDKKKEADGEADLVDQARKESLPHLIFPKLSYPLKWDDGIVGASVKLAFGVSGKSDVELVGCDLNSFVLSPMEGGTIQINMRVQCHPDQAQAGQLYMMMGTEVEVTVTYPEETAEAVAATGKPIKAPDAWPFPVKGSPTHIPGTGEDSKAA